MPLLGSTRLSSANSFLFRSSSKRDSSMGSAQSSNKHGRRSFYLNSPSTGNFDTSRSRSRNYAGLKSNDPWGPPPYTPEPDPVQPFSPEDIQASSSSSSYSSPFVQTNAEDSEYAFLANFDTIFLVDDSGSMADRYWREAEEAIAMITPICTQHDPDGIDLYFLNNSNNAQRGGGYTNIISPSAVQDIFRRVRPYGMTPVGQRLSQILFPYLRRVEKMAANTDDYGQLKNAAYAVRPINIIVITDGVFSDDAESVILNAARTLDRCQTIPWQVGIQFFQIGSDKAAQRHLEQLDDELCKAVKNDHVRDIVDTVPWKGQSGRTLSGDGVLKVVLGAVNKKLDRQKV
ncbi:hypothetical protein UA08_01052 [Talaromyces atroroseus]|uniref:VWFA domain-containing protein n=1 Tax=Talaromyces atroroseus TaxID=1441469 RepID=A0A225AYG3_TALAT|nr:hypothetical protein UA08_01052 [Talaromyces atroroseus]OKL64683.1 hypothetical protein UA08_01052 [Talaromyces atroroseus]